MCFNGGPILHLMCSIMTVHKCMFKKCMNVNETYWAWIISREGDIINRYSLDVWSDLYLILIAMPRGDLFNLLPSELSALYTHFE